MPVSIAIAAAASYAGAYVAGTAVTAGLITAGGFAFAAASAATTFVVTGVLNNAVGRGPQRAPDIQPSFTSRAEGRDQVVRSSVANRTVVYGRAMVSGPLVFAAVSGTGNSKLHMVVPLAGHEIDAVEEIYFNDVKLGNRDSSGNVTSGEYSGVAKVKVHLGTPGDAADADLVAAGVGWTSQHRLAGVAYLVVTLDWSQDKYPTGIPNIKAQIRGKKLYDPRTGLTAWSNNFALCVRDYLTGSYGLECATDELDGASFIAAANIADESITLASGGTEKRYTCNGVVDLGDTPRSIMEDLLSSAGGFLVWTGGKYVLHASAYTAPAITLTADDLRDSIKVRPRLSRSELFNAVRGTYVDPDKYWQPSDFPPVSNSTYASQDGGQTIWRDVSLPFTTSGATAQRLAKIMLERSRQGITVEFPAKLTAFKVATMDTVRVTLAQLGWSAKEFKVLEWKFSPEGGVDLVLQEETAASYNWNSGLETVIDQAPDTNLPNPFDVSAPIDLTISPTTVLATDGTAQTGLMVTWEASTNAFVSQYEMQWIRGSSNFDLGFITNASTKTVNYGSISSSPTSAEDYGLITEATSTEEPQFNSLFVTNPYYFIPQAIAGVEYAVRVRAVNTLGVRSAWTAANSLTLGDTDAPLPPDNLVAYGGYRQISLYWINPTASDFDYIEIYRNTTSSRAGAGRIAVIRASSYVDAPLGINERYYYWIKAVDRSGNISDFSAGVNAATQFVGVESFSEEVMNLFSEAGAYGIEPVSSLPTAGDFDGQIKFNTTANKLYRWDATISSWTDDIFSISSGSVDFASFASGIQPVGIVSSLPSPTGYTGANVVFNSADNKLYRYTGTEWTSSIASTDLSGTLGASNFSNNLRPVEVVNSLPSTGNFNGRVAVLTTDGKLYRHNGSLWTASVSTTDLSGSVSDAQIAGIAASKITGQLTDSQIQEISTAKLTGTISETQITNGSISTPKLASGAVTTAKLAAGAVTADTISSSAITSAKIDAGAVTAAKVAAGAIEADKIAADAVTANKIAAGAVETDKLAANAVTTGKLSAGAVTADILAANSVTAGKVAAAAISATELASSAVTADKIAAGSIVADKIAAGAIQTDKIAANAITGGLLAASGVITNAAQINDAVIANANIQNLAIGRDKLSAFAASDRSFASAALINISHSAGGSYTLLSVTYPHTAGTYTFVDVSIMYKPGDQYGDGMVSGFANSFNAGGFKYEVQQR